MVEIVCGSFARQETSSTPRVSYQDFRRLKDADIVLGMRVGPLRPSDLYASQRWLDECKIREAIQEFDNTKNPELVVPLYLHRLPAENGDYKRVLVLGDCHHRTLVWDLHGLSVDGEVEATSLPSRFKERDIIPFSRFRRLNEAQISGG